MSVMIETMESRMLLTASVATIQGDVGALTATGDAAKADLKAALLSAVSDLKAIKADVVAAKPTSTQKAAAATVKKDVVAASAKYKGIIGKILANGFADGSHLISLLKAYKAHPTNTALLSKAQATLTKLQGVFSTTVVSGVESEASATVTSVETDMNALATAVPSASTDISTAEGHLNTDLTTLSTDATAIQNAIATLVTDLA